MIYQTKLLAKSHPECQFFVTLGLGEQEFQCQKLMDNVSVVSYLPYNEYIPQMDYVIHHGGSGFFFQCIINNKPALILPHDYDQYDYAICGLEAGVALTVKREDDKAIGKAFEALLAKKDWSELKALSHAAKSYHPTEVVEGEIARLLADKEKKR